MKRSVFPCRNSYLIRGEGLSTSRVRLGELRYESCDYAFLNSTWQWAPADGLQPFSCRTSGTGTVTLPRSGYEEQIEPVREGAG